MPVLPPVSMVIATSGISPISTVAPSSASPPVAVVSLLLSFVFNWRQFHAYLDTAQALAVHGTHGPFSIVESFVEHVRETRRVGCDPYVRQRSKLLKNVSYLLLVALVAQLIDFHSRNGHCSHMYACMNVCTVERTR